MVGVHLRQADSLFIWNYSESALPGAPTLGRKGYFPVDDTERLIELVRSITRVPVMIGGFGFTTHSRRLIERLTPDFGMVGEPDDFFAHFDAVLAGADVGSVANLVHHTEAGYVYNHRVHYGPADHREYTDSILADVVDFYGESGVLAPGGAHVAVEIQRGCPHRCYFCTEPMVKGRRHQIRNLDIVMADVEFLADRGVSRVWLVCSEINIGSNKLLFDVAERMRELNRDRTHKVTWSAYLLPNPQLSRDQIRQLLRCGFEPGWNQFMSYDDRNLKDTKVPYRARHALAAQLDWALEGELFDNEQGRPSRGRRLDMFLGNSYVSAATIAITVERANALGLAEHFDGALLTRATRVFDLGDGFIGGSAGSAFSIGPDGPLPKVDLLYPTFSYPQDLVAHLGSNEAVDEFFAYVEDTFLSVAHRARQDWCEFLTNSTEEETFMQWCKELLQPMGPAVDDTTTDGVNLAKHVLQGIEGQDGDALVRSIFVPTAQRNRALGILARMLIELVIAMRIEETRVVFELIGLSGYWDAKKRTSEYEVGKALATRYGSNRELFIDIEERSGHAPDSIPSLAVRMCLYANNVRLRSDYTTLLFS
jgi:hypothetical protein